ncbi:hypothetical protein SLEP1_g14209 [Rubroshorea leprosula]|uniref:Uncharacterized protein n=1 Tax=Rubroshorea leprosula TaxID=152421 RepID=A0AAV5II96_9ROSI|nr:hypothetical protein SLEP1_g14209 [Rubroshorea leprosula]
MDFCTSCSCLSRSAFFLINSSLYLDELGSIFNFPLPLGLVGTTILLRAGEFLVATTTAGCASLFSKGIRGSSGTKRARILPIAILRTLVLSSSSVVRAGSVDLSGRSRYALFGLADLCLVPVGTWNCSGWVAYPVGVLSSSVSLRYVIVLLFVYFISWGAFSCKGTDHFVFQQVKSHSFLFEFPQTAPMFRQLRDPTLLKPSAASTPENPEVVSSGKTLRRSSQQYSVF